MTFRLSVEFLVTRVLKMISSSTGKYPYLSIYLMHALTCGFLDFADVTGLCRDIREPHSKMLLSCPIDIPLRLSTLRNGYGFSFYNHTISQMRKTYV